MPKNIEDIIVPERRKSIRDIPIPEGRKKNDRYATPPIMKEYSLPRTQRDNLNTIQEDRKFSTTTIGRKRKGTWLAIGATLLILVFTVLAIFDGATLAYVPKSAAISFDNDVYTAAKSGEGELLYSVVKLSGDKGLEVPASGTTEVSRKASGTIIVYNNASSEPQRLVETTRFETPDGLVYRIPDAIVIPGRKTVSGVTEPGSIETIVYADVGGAKHNIALSDFTLPGLKGGTRFTTIYARSKTPMSGGFVGTEKVVSDEDKARVKAELEQVLKEELISEAVAQVPEEFVLFPSLSFVTFEDLPQTASANTESVMVNKRANLSGVMFKKSDLSNHLSLEKIARTPSELVDIIALESLNLSFVSTPPSDLLLSPEINFSVTGEVTALWRTDEVALKADLVGKHKKDIPSILNNYPTVVQATATTRPFWKSSFPSDSAKISIKKLPVN